MPSSMSEYDALKDVDMYRYACSKGAFTTGDPAVAHWEQAKY